MTGGEKASLEREVQEGTDHQAGEGHGGAEAEGGSHGDVPVGF